ncbi:restriction endonuclease subunit S [Lactiplantibacillus plantarum]|nr:restriction endonuclease subunit S [Lactiplantibacillus plantarum]
MGGNKLKKGEVLFTTEAPMGNVAQVPDDAGYILSQRTISFKVFNDKVTDDFLAVILSSNGVQNKLKSLSSGGTALGISQRSLKGLKITLPVSLKEQSEISALIKLLSGLIAANQRKLEKLQELKKGYLQKMFC